MSIPLYDLAFGEWSVKDLILLVASVVSSAVVGVAASTLYRRSREQREAHKLIEHFWKSYLPAFCEEDFQAAVGACGGLSNYDVYAARRVVVPGMRSILGKVHKGMRTRKIADFLSADRTTNLLVLGGNEPSKIAETLLNSEDVPLITGVKNRQMALFDAPSEALSESRSHRLDTKDAYGEILAAGDTFIGNKSTKKIVFEPSRRSGGSYDGSYRSDAALLTLAESPWESGKWILNIAGARETGTLFGAESIVNPQYVGVLLKALHEKGIAPGDGFQAVVEFTIGRYVPKRLPSARVLENVQVGEVVKL